MITVMLEVGDQQVRVSLAELEKLHAELMDFFFEAEEEEVEEELPDPEIEPDDEENLEDETAPDEDWP